MTKDDYYKWGDKFFKAWANLDPDAVLRLLSNDVEYHETPFSGPSKSFEDVMKLWSIVSRNQKDITYTFNVVMTDDNQAFIYSNVKRTTMPEEVHQEIDGISLIKLNKEGLCTLFKQWRVVKE